MSKRNNGERAWYTREEYQELERKLKEALEQKKSLKDDSAKVKEAEEALKDAERRADKAEEALKDAERRADKAENALKKAEGKVKDLEEKLASAPKAIAKGEGLGGDLSFLALLTDPEKEELNIALDKVEELREKAHKVARRQDTLKGVI